MNRSITIVGGLLLLGLSGLGAGGQESDLPEPGKNLPNEPVARSFSPAKAAAWLDAVAVNWTRKRKCGTCHTNLPYLWARPSLKSFQSPAMGEVRGFFERLADTWEIDKPPRKYRLVTAWQSQIVTTAVTLAIHDSRTTNELHPLTRKAFDKMWVFQREDGSWDWPKCDWPPMEHDDYFGATYVALGVGMAPGEYARSDAAKPGLEKLRRYLKTHQAPDLHHKMMLLWASGKLEGLMSTDERDAVVRELRALQKKDGGWCLPSFGGWKRHDDTPNAKDGPSDGYATGLAIVVLRDAGFAADDAQIKRGVEWLKSNQRESGRWFTQSLSIDDQHFVTHVGTAYAVMALDACGELH
ncbi:MAG TPA: prenyltransferase/squalene oxidase repeat-containing protein [Planctomycetota bacterium]|nr:prenyltransferase/squalene oxidase repeat-containing protein [Planctomycetota bacterium]